MLLSVLPATSMAASYATVVGGWLRLRSAPNFSASTITSYYTGTQVEILAPAEAGTRFRRRMAVPAICTAITCA